MHESFTTKLYGPVDRNQPYHRTLLFVGTQAGCQQVVKERGLQRSEWYVMGVNRFERALMQSQGKPLTGKAKEYFQTHCF